MHINIYEVGPRDGLQNSAFDVDTQQKIHMIDELYRAGLTNMEITSFVHPKLVPKMADAERVYEGTKHLGDFGVLVPNERGLQRALQVGATKFNVFFSPSNAFNSRNLGKGLETTFHHYSAMLEDIDMDNVRAYISCAFGCPFEGRIKEHELVDSINKAAQLADTVVLCDTIGACHPTQMLQTLELTRGIDADIALHLHHDLQKHDNMFTNIKAAVDWGVDTFDSSIGGLGGCPFIPHSGGNLSTNALIEWAHSNGYETGIELDDLEDITNWVSSQSRELYA